MAKAGFAIVPVNVRIPAEGTPYVINHSDSVAFIYHEEFEDKVRAIRQPLKNVNHYIIIGSGKGTAISFESVHEGSSVKEPEEALRPDDMIMYTGGTRGNPKGVIATHRNIMANTTSMIIDKRIVPEDRNLLVMPLYHNGGLWPTMTHF